MAPMPVEYTSRPLSFISRPGSGMMLEILFEDEWLLAVDKPAGLVVHPAYKNPSGTLLDIVRERDAAVVFSIVGRLDKLTSGVVVLAKSAAAHAALQRVWPEVEKDYLAVVRGRVDVAAGVIDLPLVRIPPIVVVAS